MRYYSTIFALLVCLPAVAAELKIDLASEKLAEQLVAPATYDSITLLNAIPYKTYQVAVKRETHPIQPLDIKKATDDMKAFATSLAGGQDDPNAVRNPCTAEAIAKVVEKAEALENATSEEQVPRLADALLNEIRVSKCKDEELTTPVRALLAQTTRKVDTHLPLVAGDFATVTVKRVSGDTTTEWVKKFDTGERGAFLTHFGMSFLPDRDDRFFTKQTGEAEFTITKKNDRHTADYAPTVFFTWTPEALRSRNLVLGPTVGLGFDLEHPTAMVGMSFVYNRTWGVALGAAAQPQDRLVGEYNPGDKLKEQLAEDRLVESTVRPNFFISILWRRD